MWKTVMLGEYITVQNGYAFNSKLFDADGEIGLIRIRDLKEGISTETRYTGDYDRKFVVQRGDLLIGMDGEFRCYEWKGENALLNQRVCRLQDFDSELDKRFLLYAINDELKKIEDVTGFTTVKHLSSKSIKEIPLYLPPLAEQQRIVAKLDAAFAEIDEAIELARNRDDVVKRLEASLLSSVLNNIDYSEVKLGVILKTGAGGTPLKSNKAFYENGKIRWLLSGAVCEKYINNSRTYITEEGLANSSAKLFPQDTVLIAMYGATAGQVGILKTEAATNQAVCGIYPSSNYLPEFLYYYLTNYKKTLLLEVSGVAQPNLSQVKIKNIPLPQIPLSEQQSIVAKLDAAFTEIGTTKIVIDNIIEDYQILKAAILAQELQSEAA